MPCLRLILRSVVPLALLARMAAWWVVLEASALQLMAASEALGDLEVAARVALLEAQAADRLEALQEVLPVDLRALQTVALRLVSKGPATETQCLGLLDLPVL